MQERNNELYRLINFKVGTSLDNITQWPRPLRFRRHGRTKSVTESAGISNRFRFKMAQYRGGLEARVANSEMRIICGRMSHRAV